MKLIATKTENGKLTGEIAFYCRVLKVSRQGFYSYLESLEKPWKYEALAAKIKEMRDEDECNDTYGRYRMHKALELKKEAEGGNFPHIPCERTVYRIMEQLGIAHTPKRKPNGITKADREAMKSDDKIKRDFTAERPLEKAVTDITEVYVSTIEDCFDNAVLGLSIATNMKAGLCVDTLKSAIMAYPGLREALIHSDRGSQYTSVEYRQAIERYGIIQRGRFKEELLYGRYDTKKMSMYEQCWWPVP